MCNKWSCPGPSAWPVNPLTSIRQNNVLAPFSFYTVDGSNNHPISSEDQSCMLDAGEHNDTASDGDNNDNTGSNDQKCCE